ncbi:MAG: NAD(P)H-hydrate dehydratase, partial [Ruminococcus sp.]|nr:NAD(P)H-hydrate dehydratase [Ruminococcus sp.]
RIVTPENMRDIEDESERLGVSKKQLMENAGKKLAELIDGYCNGDNEKKIVFLVGNGNNGGDCSVSAGILADMEYKNISMVMVCGTPKTELAKEMYNRVVGCVNIPADFQTCISEADILIDGVFGTGFHGELDTKISDIFALNKNAYRIAVDVSSGGNSHTGTVSEGTFRADETLAFGFLKSGMSQYPLKDFCGKITVADIGIPEKAIDILKDRRKYTLIEREDFADFPPHRKSTSHKGTFGKVLIIAGSNSMRGAGFFAVSGALRSGAGLVQLATVGKCIDTVSVLAPESTFIEMSHDENGFMRFEPEKLDLKKYNAVVIGCGMGVTRATFELTKFVVENSEIPVIIDADGINCIALDIDILLKKKTDIILTPHVGEMVRLLNAISNKLYETRLPCKVTMECPHIYTVDEVSEKRFRSAQMPAIRYNVNVVLKGAGTIITNRSYTAVNPTGNAGMSRGGSGDILAGMIGAIAGQGYSAFRSACIGTYMHGLAGDIASEKFTQEAMLPRDILNCLSDSFRKIK